MDSAQSGKTKTQLKKEGKRAKKSEKYNAKVANQGVDGSIPVSTTKPGKEKEGVKKVTYTVSTESGAKKDVACEMPDSYSPSYVEAAWYEWWEKSGFFMPEYGGRALDGSNPRGKFVMVIPPPNVTGSLHVGHALTNSIEDAITRWRRMRGETVLWVPGCDHAGIATQVVVEKKLARECQKTRHDIGREAFIEEIWKWKKEKGDRIYGQLRKLGSSCDWTRARFTMETKMYRAVTEAFVRLHDEGLIYRAKRLINWSCALRSAISEIEVEKRELTGRTLLDVPGYKEKVEFGVLVHFNYPILDSNTGEVIEVATTRLETMLGDTAIAVHPTDQRYLHLHGRKARHPLITDRILPIICDAYVDPSFGTGAVKITPAHDPNDFAIGARHGLPTVEVINEDGVITSEGGEFAGMPRFQARKAVQTALEKLGLYRGTKENPMTVPICSRSKDVIEFLLKPQWFLNCREMALAAKLAVEEGRLRLVPDMHVTTWNQWLGDCQDWCISRQLWWGHRIPAYLVDVNGESSVDPMDNNSWVSGRDENEARQRAAERAGVPLDQVRLTQDTDVLDTWFSSQLFPFSVFDWPDTTCPDLSHFYPTSLLETGHDILFFWVARMVMIGLQLTGKLPFNTVYLHAMVRDAHGKKMSKSLGNAIDPLNIIEGISLADLHRDLELGNLDPRELARARDAQSHDYPNGIPECGTDALRFALCSYTSQGRDVNLDVLRVQGYRFFCNKLWNATRYALYHSLGTDYRPHPTMATTEEQFGSSGILSRTDRWILSRLANAVAECNAGFQEYLFPQATTGCYNFWLYELCDVYLEYTKPIVKSEDTGMSSLDKQRRQAVQEVLYTCLEVALRLIHPFMPFISEELFQRLARRQPLTDPPSICVMAYPEPEQFPWRNPGIEDEMKLANDIIHAVRSVRANYRLPAGKAIDAILVLADADTRDSVAAYLTDLIRPLARLGDVRLAIDTAEVDLSGTVVSTVSAKCVLHLRLAGLIDVAKEMDRLDKRMADIHDQVANLHATRNKPHYSKVADAKRDQDAQKLTELTEELATMAAARRTLATLLSANPIQPSLDQHSLVVRLTLKLHPEGVKKLPDTSQARYLDVVSLCELVGGEELRGGNKLGDQARVKQWSVWCRFNVLPLVPSDIPDQSTKSRHGHHHQRQEKQLSDYLNQLDRWLYRHKYLALDSALTLADLHLYAAIYQWRDDPVLIGRPNLHRWLTRTAAEVGESR